MSAIKRFDPQTRFLKSPVALVLGRRETGKSVLLHNLFHHCDVSSGTVVTHVDQNVAREMYESAVSSDNIHSQLSPVIMTSFVERQTSAMKIWAKAKEVDSDRADHEARTALVLDCVFDLKWMQDRCTRFLFMNGRRIKTSLLIGMSYAHDLGAVLRTNIDFVFMLRESTHQGRRRLYDMYACDAFATFDEFCAVFDSVTENHGCLVIDRNAPSDKSADRIFWYKAEYTGLPPTPPPPPDPLTMVWK